MKQRKSTCSNSDNRRLGRGKIQPPFSLRAERVQRSLESDHRSGVSDPERGNRWKRAFGALLVYDVSRRATFDNVARWLDELNSSSDTTVAKMLVGNKCDLEDSREVSLEEGKILAASEGLFFVETSALDSTNVQTAFEIVIREIYNNVSRKVLSSDSYKAELTINRVSLVNGDGLKQSETKYSCCSS
ncbi:Ras-related protein RABA5a [Hibiscus syriacus]|uniref:Ras-related protein RABA5a n=1 Tax=Hibiscus syriacus TaxID=106335 RepID=A0A6A3CXN8_HIBSY|nr:Ras-related protein RABA5a [Hibiscus syriacus]